MSDLGHANWSETAASNNVNPPNGLPENMNPSDVNNSGRESMAATKRFWDQINAVKTTGGTSTAYTLTYSVASGALYDGELVTFVLHATCGAAPTLNKNGLGAKNLRKFTAGAWTNLAASDLVVDQIVLARYNLGATKWDVIVSCFNLTDFARTTATVAMVAAINEAKGADIASATTTNIGAATGNLVHVTGTTTITGLGTVQAGTERTVVFDGILTLTHNATSLILPTGANITTAAGDSAVFRSEGAGNWKCVGYERASGIPLVVPVAHTVIANSLPADVALSNTANYFTGPSVAQGTTGTWLVSGTVTVASVSFSAYYAKLWDGTTVIDSTSVTGSTAGGSAVTISLSGVITTPAGNIRISVRNVTATDGSILFNLTGESKDSTLTAVRLS